MSIALNVLQHSTLKGVHSVQLIGPDIVLAHTESHNHLLHVQGKNIQTLQTYKNTGVTCVWDAHSQGQSRILLAQGNTLHSLVGDHGTGVFLLQNTQKVEGIDANSVVTVYFSAYEVIYDEVHI